MFKVLYKDLGFMVMYAVMVLTFIYFQENQQTPIFTNKDIRIMDLEHEIRLLKTNMYCVNEDQK